MNPFKDIDPKKGLGGRRKEDRRSPFYGRFRLIFNQAIPFYEPTYGRTFIKIKEDAVDMLSEVLSLYDTLPDHIKRVIHMYQQKEVKNTRWMIDCFEDEDYFLVFEVLSDVLYIAMENLYFAMKELSIFLEDCHFFVYSTGDGDDRWLDEYSIKDGELSMDRHICDIENIFGQLHFYIRRALLYPEDRTFRRFAVYQVKDNGIFSNFLKRVKKDPDKVKSEAPELFQLYQDYKKLVR